MNKQTIENNVHTVSRWETPQLVNSKKDSLEKAQEEEQSKLAAHNEGFKSGYESGLEQASKEISERIKVADNFLLALSRPFSDQNHQLVEHIAAIAGKIAKSLVRRELRSEPETIMALVRDTVAALNTTEQDIAIHLHPINAQIIRDMINSDTQEKAWTIIDDPLVSHSDCKVTCQDSLIDADLQTRIDLMITQFLGDERNEGRK